MSSRAIADTSLFIARETGRPLEPYEEDLEIAVSIVTIAELEMGVLAAAAPRIRAARLQTLRDAEQLTPLPVDRAVASAFATLVVEAEAEAEAERECDGWPVVGVACGDAVFGLVVLVLVVGGGFPFDGHDLQCCERHQDRERTQRAAQELLSSNEWARWVRTRAMFHNYSAKNCALLAWQCHERGIVPTRIAGFRT